MFIPQIKNVGRWTYSAPDLIVANPNHTIIGSFTSIGNRVCIGHGTHPLSYLTTSPYIYLDRLNFKSSSTVSHNEWEILEAIKIGNDVWIGDNVFIKNGIKIGDGAIIGAKSVVTHDVPPYAIVCGNPANILRYRFDETVINELLELKWWDLPDEDVKTLPYDNIEKCIEKLRELRSKK